MSRLLAGPPLFGGPKKFYHRDPKPLSGALTTTINPLCDSLLQQSALVSIVAPIYSYVCNHFSKSVVETAVLFKSFTQSQVDAAITA